MAALQLPEGKEIIINFWYTMLMFVTGKFLREK